MQSKKITAKQLKSKNAFPTIKVDGREYEINFNFLVLGELEEIYGNIETALTILQKGKINDITNFVYAVMKSAEGNEGITVREVGRKLDLNFINEIQGKMGTAMANSFGEPETGKDNLGE